MKKEKKGLSRKMNFFYDLSIMKQKRNLRKICVQLLLMAFVLSPLKQYRSGETKHTKMLSTNLVSSQKTSDARCCQFLFLFHFFLPFLGGRRLELFIQDPVIQKVRNLKYNSGNNEINKTIKNFTQICLVPSISCVNLLYLTRNHKEISERGIETQKIILNTYVLRQAKICK